MNSIWNKNIELFSRRFPSLAQSLNLSDTEEPDFDFWEVVPSKSQTLTARENGIFLHSAYNPLREAESQVKAAKNDEIWSVLFCGIGLGYSAVKWAELYPDDTIIIAEPAPDYFFAALKYNDFSALFSHKKLILALQAGTEQITGLVENSGGFNHTAIIENKAHSLHAQDYYSALLALIERNRKKEQINTATLEKFSKLWLKNSCRNIRSFAKLDGVKLYENKCPETLPALLISAGPTLSNVLPHLKELKKRCILVAVDTALRACLKAGTEPDFIVLTDPQYYAYRHIAGLKSPSSVLITESAAWPDVYRFSCRKIVLTSSLFPLGQYFEQKLGSKGTLGAGGSVSTTAWDFARLTGAKTIYCAGLDLGYPKLQSHIRGSLFEEKAHQNANRKNPSEKSLSTSLFAANSMTAKDYDGNLIFTDDKMKMFAWWFESKAQQYSNIQCYSLSSQSLAIPGFSFSSLESLLQQKEGLQERNSFFEAEKTSVSPASEKAFNLALEELKSGFESLYASAKKGYKIAETALNAVTPAKYIQELNLLDKEIMQSEFKEAASLVFPSENKLASMFSETAMPEDQTKVMFIKSRIIYRELMNGIRLYQTNLFE